ncbi:MAG TPA: ATP-dependent zinc metalloprotease FtsH [Alphaproteobacteria bacterium]|nr:ATP-dependent zinc metalloprotease FtsH [Alphaproteobacteria bacterium]
MDKKTKYHIWYAIAAIFGIYLLQSWWMSNRSTESIPYSQFEQYLQQGKIRSVAVGNQVITGTLKAPDRNGATRFATIRVAPDIAQQLAKAGVTYTGTTGDSVLQDVLSWIVPTAIFFGLWFFVVRRMAERQGFGGLMQIGKSKARIYVERDTKTTFDDVAGVDEAKEELREVVEFLKSPKTYGRLGARVPKGILLVGPPGTGKTMLARAVAGEAGVPFFSISGPEFVEMFVGVGAARVRDLFVQARAKAPAIVFIDELDALGRARSAAHAAGGFDEREQTLNQLLTELDGFDPREGIVLLAATNRPEILDPALLRAGRFDRQILVDRPDKEGRIQILKVHMRKARLASDVDPEQIAALTTGFSGADLANLVNEAAILATRRRAEAVTMDDFTRAIERMVAGLEKKNRLLNPKEREVVAYHEMGHALVSLALPSVDRIHKVSIIPRGIGALGYTIQRPTEDRFLMSRAELEDKIAVLLGGRAAEKLVFQQLSTGAADDLAKATDIARSMVARYGMDDGLGYVTYDSDKPSFLGQPADGSYFTRRFSEATAERIDEAVQRIIAEVFARATQILSENRAVLDRSAHALLAAETLDEHALADLTKNLKRAPRPRDMLRGPDPSARKIAG